MKLKAIHRYLGLSLSLIMLVISITGTLLLWKKEFLWLDIDDARQVVDVSLLPNAIENIESQYAADELSFIQLHSEDLAVHKVFLSGRRYAWHNQNGKQLQVWSSNDRFEDWLLDLHHRFLLGNNIGLQIAGFGGLLLMPLLILGLLIWWSRRRALRLGLLPKSMLRGDVMRSHGNIGAVFLIPIFLLSLTGVILVYPSESRTLLVNGFGDDTPPVVQEMTYDASQGYPDWKTLIIKVYKRFPGAKIRSITPDTSKNLSRTVAFQQTEGWHRLGRSSMKYRLEGQLIIKDELQQPLQKRVFGFSYPIHTAKLGLLYKLGLSIVGLAFTLLCFLGLVSFLKRPTNRS
jgi:uncharacterized iron-regulated membrane protein